MKCNFAKLLCLLMALVLVAFLLPQVSLQTQAEEVELSDLLKGKTLSILGDSISTFQGISDGAGADTSNSTIRNNRKCYPTTFLNDANDTWWKQATQELGLEILVNNSWSGSHMLKLREYSDGTPSVPGAYVDRCVQLHDDTGDNAGEKPDIIAIYMGTNDFDTNYANVGTYDTVNFDTLITGSEGAYTYATPVTTMEAYAISLHKISQAYPNAEVYCFTLLPRESATYRQPTQFNADIKILAAHFGAYVVDLYGDSGITNDPAAFDTMMGDSLHPNPNGMDAITDTFVAAILKNSKYLPEGTVVHNVSYALTNVLGMGGTPKTVRNGAALEVTLIGSNPFLNINTVTVTMGGQDITASCYADGVISIPAVTGDVVITADSVSKLGEHSHDCEHCDDAQWKPWDGNVSSLSYGGHFYLTENVTMDTAFVSANMLSPDIDITICLNGYTLYGPKTDRLFRLSMGTALTFVDCTAKTENGTYTAGKIVPQYHGIKGTVAAVYTRANITDPGSSFTMYDGIIDGDKKSNADIDNPGGGLIDLGSGNSTVNLYGGVLKDYTGYTGGAIYAASGSINLENVTIENCSAGQGGAIYAAANSRVNIVDGAISNCTATAAANAGGAIYTEATTKTVDGIQVPGVIIDGTIISGCKAPNGGGGALVLLQSATVEMKAGKITGSESNWEGEVIRMPGSGATFTMSGGEITENYAPKIIVRIGGTFIMTGGHIHNNTDGTAYGYEVDVYGNATISGDARISASTYHSNQCRAINALNGGTVTISGGTINGIVYENPDTKPVGEVNITGGTFANGGVYGGAVITGGTFQYNVKHKLVTPYTQFTSGEVCTDAHFWEETGEVTAEPSCSTVGKETYECTNCSATKTQDIPTVDHDWADATCTAPKTCKNCPATDGEKLGHDYAAAVTNPTCTTVGYTTYIGELHYQVEYKTIPVDTLTQLTQATARSCSNKNYR